MKSITSVLSFDQIERVKEYYHNHQRRVQMLVLEANKAFSPSEPEDKNDPSIWKPEYWKWFSEAEL